MCWRCWGRAKASAGCKTKPDRVPRAGRPLHSLWEEKPLWPRGRAISTCHVRYASAAKLRRCRRLAVHTGMGYAKKRLPPRASGSTWRKPSHRPEGNAIRRATQIEGSIMDAKTGANIKTGKFVVGDR